MLIHFKGKKHYLHPGDAVEVDERHVFSASPDANWQPAVIVDMLSQQFTCHLIDDDRIRFCPFNGVGRSWRPI